MKTSVLVGAVGAALLLAGVASAQDTAAPAAAAPVATAAVPHVGELLRDRDGRRLGKIETVRPDNGVLTVIADMKIMQVPLSSLSSDGKILKTSLSSSELRSR